MDLKEAIEKRRAYYSLEKVEITDEIIHELGRAAQLAPSCYNNQPWKYVFVYDPIKLKEMHEALSRGNAWAREGSMIIAVFSKPDLDCRIKKREYYQFDTGMATAFLILRAVDLGLVAHPIAGYDPEKVRRILEIPGDYLVITLVVVGGHSRDILPSLSEKQVEIEKKRPPRLPLDKFIFTNSFPPD